jgi:hypothetical protein
MSRFTCRHEDGWTVAYGLDHALGWFYQEFDAYDNCITDEDTFSTGLGRGRLLELLEQTDALESHKSAIALDLCPSDPQGMESCL